MSPSNPPECFPAVLYINIICTLDTQVSVACIFVDFLLKSKPCWLTVRVYKLYIQLFSLRLLELIMFVSSSSSSSSKNPNTSKRESQIPSIVLLFDGEGGSFKIRYLSTQRKCFSNFFLWLTNRHLLV